MLVKHSFCHFNLLIIIILTPIVHNCNINERMITKQDVIQIQHICKQEILKEFIKRNITLKNFIYHI